MFIHRSITDTIGNTPVVSLRRLAPGGGLHAKLESANPGGSVKDRMALAMIEAAERSGALHPGQTVVEASSGNAGISLAMVCAARGYPLVIVMGEQFSVERRRLMRFLGARVVLTPAHLKGSGMVEKARELAATHGWFWPRQFENQANAEVHERHTGPEIAAAFAGRRLDYVVLGTGTGGSLRGIGHALRRLRPDVRLVVAEPDNAPLLSGGRPQPEHGSHPDFRPHPMQGWTPDFIPLHTAAALTEDLVHRVMPVGGDQALATSRDLARREGILAGITSGATVAAGLRLLAEEPAAEVLCLLPDTGERYLSTPLFDDIGQDMDAGEWEISRSSPTARFDAPGRGAAPTVPLPPASSVDESVLRWFEGVVRDPAQPVVAFTLAWCEFSWSLRRLFERIGLPFRVVELDAPPLREAGLDLQLRALLHIRTGQPTLPQVFVGGRYLGGCTETMAAFRNGELARRVEAAGLDPSRWPSLDPEQFLPRWRQHREALA